MAVSLNDESQGLEDKMNSLLIDITSSRAVLAGMLVATLVVDLGSIADQAELAQEITVTGAVLGDFVLVSCSIDSLDLLITAQVTAADTVTVVLGNLTAGAIDLGSQTLAVSVLPVASFIAPAALNTTAGT